MEAFLLIVGPFAVATTKLVDLVRYAVDPAKSRVPSVVWVALSFVVGVGMALLWQLDYVSTLENIPPALERLNGVWGQVITGLGIGAVSAGWYELFRVLSTQSAKNTAVARTATDTVVKVR